MDVLYDLTSENKEDYNPLTVLIDYNSPMNKVCHYMEKELSGIKRYSSSTTDSKIIELLRTEKDLQDNNKKDIITIVGAGGKTSLMLSASSYLRKDYKVLVTTTTHIYMTDKKYYD